MHKLLYVSSTRRNVPSAELKNILAVARTNNATLGVTGLLLYIDGGFMQVLEGERNILHRLYQVISTDDRHWDAQLLLDQAGERNFSKWDMGFKSLDDDCADASLIGITQGAIQGLIKPGSAKPVLDILIQTFRTVQGVA